MLLPAIALVLLAFASAVIVDSAWKLAKSEREGEDETMATDRDIMLLRHLTPEAYARAGELFATFGGNAGPELWLQMISSFATVGLMRVSEDIERRLMPNGVAGPVLTTTMRGIVVSIVLPAMLGFLDAMARDVRHHDVTDDPYRAATDELSALLRDVNNWTAIPEPHRPGCACGEGERAG